jgi:hypothetical protein
MLSAAPHNLFIFLSLQGPGKQSAEWQPSSFSLKPDESPNIEHSKQPVHWLDSSGIETTHLHI